MRTSWESYRGKDILRVDYRKLKHDEFKAAVQEVSAFVLEQERNDLLELVDFTGCFVDISVFELLKENVAKTKVKVEKTAVLGVSGIKKNLMTMLLTATKRTNVKAFVDEQVAKEWLIS